MLSIDAMMSIIPLVLIFIFLMQSMSIAAWSEEERSATQDLFDRLVSVADYTVKSGAARHEGGIRYPNWVTHVDNEYKEELRKAAGLSRLEISFSEPEGYGLCIYRLVVTSSDRRISNMYFCGE
jgi:hypothetical protein